VIGYALHGAWDLVHELQAQEPSPLTLGQLTAVPLAYGVFCAALDVCIAAYAFKRRDEWSAAWRRSCSKETTPAADRRRRERFQHLPYGESRSAIHS